MQCEQVETLLGQLASGETPGTDPSDDPRLAEAAAHVEGCERCREKVADYRLTLKIVAEGITAAGEPKLSADRFAALAEVLRTPLPKPAGELSPANLRDAGDSAAHDPLPFASPLPPRFRAWFRPVSVAASFALVAVGAWGLAGMFDRSSSRGYFANAPVASAIDTSDSGTLMIDDMIAAPGDAWKYESRIATGSGKLGDDSISRADEALGKRMPEVTILTDGRRSGDGWDSAEASAIRSDATGFVRSKNTVPDQLDRAAQSVQDLVQSKIKGDLAVPVEGRDGGAFYGGGEGDGTHADGSESLGRADKWLAAGTNKSADTDRDGISDTTPERAPLAEQQLRGRDYYMWERVTPDSALPGAGGGVGGGRGPGDAPAVAGKDLANRANLLPALVGQSEGTIDLRTRNGVQSRELAQDLESIADRQNTAIPGSFGATSTRGTPTDPAATVALGGESSGQRGEIDRLTRGLPGLPPPPARQPPVTPAAPAKPAATTPAEPVVKPAGEPSPANLRDRLAPAPTPAPDTPLIVKTYDIRDLLVDAPSFAEAPDFDLVEVTRAPGSGPVPAGDKNEGYFADAEGQTAAGAHRRRAPSDEQTAPRGREDATIRFSVEDELFPGLSTFEAPEPRDGQDAKPDEVALGVTFSQESEAAKSRQPMAAQQNQSAANGELAQVAQQRESLKRTIEMLEAEKLPEQFKERAGEAKKLEDQRRQVAEVENKVTVDEARPLTHERSETRAAASAERDVKLRQLLARAAEMQQGQELEKSAQVLDELLFLDPDNVAGKAMKAMVEDGIIWKNYRDLEGMRNQKVAAHSVVDNKAAVLPHTELITYPPDWPEITEGERKRLATVEGRTEANRRAVTALTEPIPVHFEDNRLDNVIEYFRSVTGVNIAVNWRALEQAGIEPGTTVTLSLQNVPAERALQLVLDQLGGDAAPLGATVDTGVLVISTQKQIDAITKGAPAKPQAAQPAQPADDEADALPAASNFKIVPVNPFVLTESDRFSTFGLDTDTASYALARKYIAAGFRPPAGAIRMEEFVNAFDYNYPTQGERVFAVHAEAAPAPYGENLTLVKVAVKARTVGRDARKPAHLVFVIDASGSMDRPDRLPLVKHSLGLLTRQLGPDDRVSVIAYGTRPVVVAEHEAATDPGAILRAIASIQAGGSTNMTEALASGYEIARRHFGPGRINRVILCSDGVANIGATDAQQMLDKVASERKQGITLTNVGFGIGGYNDALMTDLAKKGDGNYVFVDTTAEAKRHFVDNLASTLQTVAKDAKIQVEFNPQRVRRYRLIGYERRDIADADFRNDAVDAGEVGSGQSATALYEVELLAADRNAAKALDNDLGTLFVRYKDTDRSDKVEEISYRLADDIVDRPSVSDAPRLYLAASAAEFAEVLRGSEHARTGSLEAIEQTLIGVTGALPLDRQAAELLELVRRCKGLPTAP